MKVADVAWLSRDFIALNGFDTPYDLARGTREVWTCDLEGNVQFHDASGKLERSLVVPDFPTLVSLE